MIAVGYALVSAARPVLVLGVVHLAVVRRRAVRRILGSDGHPMLVDVIAVHAVEVSVMQVVRVAFVLDG